MKKIVFFALASLVSSIDLFAQDTLLFQDFESVPSTSIPVWNYTGTPYEIISGFSASTAEPSNSPLGIGGSNAWHVVQVSGGNPLVFDNALLPSSYDSVAVTFQLAAMNLNGTGGGPDDLDYVQIELSLNGGSTFYSRVRIRGAVANNSTWDYDATGLADVSYLPANEVVFQPTITGPQVAEGYSRVTVRIPTTESQVSVRITPRSSSSTDSWLIDNVMLIGYTSCVPTIGSSNVSICQGDSILVGGAYQTLTGTYTDTLVNSGGCDSVLTTQLSLLPNYTTTPLEVSVCAGDSILLYGAYQSVSGMYYDTLQTVQGCDSILSTNLTITNVDVSVTAYDSDSLVASNASGSSYQWIDCSTNDLVLGAVNSTFIPTVSGNFAVIINDGTCSDTSACFAMNNVGLQMSNFEAVSIFPNPFENSMSIQWDQSVDMDRIQLYSLQGKLVFDQEVEGKYQAIISTTELAVGTYLLKVKASGKYQTYRVIKQ